MEHIELKLKLIRDLKSQTMVVPRGTHLEGVESVPTNVPRGTHREVIPVTDFLNTVSIMGGKEIHVIIKDGAFVIAHCKVVGGVASVVGSGWAGRSYSLLEMLREVGY